MFDYLKWATVRLQAFWLVVGSAVVVDAVTNLAVPSTSRGKKYAALPCPKGRLEVNCVAERQGHRRFLPLCCLSRCYQDFRTPFGIRFLCSKTQNPPLHIEWATLEFIGCRNFFKYTLYNPVTLQQAKAQKRNGLYATIIFSETTRSFG